jgi:myo-inositol-1-phosphate synthase
MTSVRVAIVGVGNCASSLVQGVQYYRDADPASTVPGLMHVQFGDYHVSDLEFVAAFDVDAKKVGFEQHDQDRRRAADGRHGPARPDPRRPG